MQPTPPVVVCLSREVRRPEERHDRLGQRRRWVDNRPASPLPQGLAPAQGQPCLDAQIFFQGDLPCSRAVNHYLTRRKATPEAF
jgi:hypothetical protein